MQGHTDRATINKRRPMTPATRDLLADMARGGGYAIGCSFAAVSRARALLDRGYAAPPDRPGGFWCATEAGHAALQEKVEEKTS